MARLLGALLALIVAWPGIPPGPVYLDATTADPPTEQATVSAARGDGGQRALPSEPTPPPSAPLVFPPRRLPLPAAAPLPASFVFATPTSARAPPVS